MLTLSDIFVSSLRRAKAAVVSEDIVDCPGLCSSCKQDETSFVGIVSCACDMEVGLASKGVPQWIYEEGKIDIEDHVNFYTDPFSQYVRYDDTDRYDGYGQCGGAVCEVCLVNGVENLGYDNMCRVCEAAAYSAESAELSEAQFVGGEPNIHGDFLTEGV